MEKSINKTQSNLNRRKFFKTGLTVAGGSLLASAGFSQNLAEQGKKGKLSKQDIGDVSASSSTGRRKLGGKLEVSSRNWKLFKFRENDCRNLCYDFQKLKPH
jgi:hypothetical protein